MTSQSAPYFSLPVQPGRLPLSYRAAAVAPRTRKRKRDVTGSAPASSSSSASDGDSRRTASRPSSPRTISEKGGPSHATGASSIDQAQTKHSSAAWSLPARDAEQYRVAGQPFDETLPGNNFPHRRSSRDETSQKQNVQQAVVSELLNLNPPLYPAGTLVHRPEVRSGLGQHLRHLSVITTILHRCLLEGDYVRASRAWGLILRSDIGGRAPDIRGQGRWGIGAELLLRRDGQLRQRLSSTEPSGAQKDEDDGSVSSKGSAEPSRRWPATHEHHEFSSASHVTTQGLAEAKDYYERLILQYPYSRLHPKAVNALNFYPAMFALWIWGVQEKERQGEKPRCADRTSRASSPSSSTHGSGRSRSSSPVSSSGDDTRTRPRSTRAETFDEAVAIAARLDDLLSSPPCSDNLNLWSLRGMVALWLRELCSDALSHPHPATEEDEGHEDEDVRLRRRADEEYDRAREAFGKVKRGGGDVWEGVPGEFRSEAEPEEGGEDAEGGEEDVMQRD